LPNLSVIFLPKNIKILSRVSKIITCQRWDVFETRCRWTGCRTSMYSIKRWRYLKWP